MHGPDRDCEREGGAGKERPAPHAGRIADLHCEMEAHIGALDRHHDREQDKPRLVGDRHGRHPWAGVTHDLVDGNIEEFAPRGDSRALPLAACGETGDPRSGYRSLRVFADHHPRDAELVRQHAELLREEGLVERHVDRRPLREAVEHPLGFLRRFDPQRHRVAGRSVVATGRCVGPHQLVAADLQAGMQDLLLPLGRDLACGRRALVGQHREDLAASHALVELERFLAPAVEHEVRVDVHGSLQGERSCENSAPTGPLSRRIPAAVWDRRPSFGQLSSGLSRPGESSHESPTSPIQDRERMVSEIDAPTLKAWLSDRAEIAFLDVREAGQFGEGHPFFAVPLPYSRFELGLPDLVPNPNVRLVLCDGGDGIAARAAQRAAALGYRNLHILAGGIAAWRRAGYTLYAGVNVPSKTFGELVEQRRHTPRITAAELEAMREEGENIVIVDGRPYAEYHRMNIPDGICCPNGELALRIKDIAPDPKTKIVVNCAGRTRSIIGAQTLIDFGVPNPVVALENGTQGWFLAGFKVENGATRRYPEAEARDVAGLSAGARAFAERHGVGFVQAEQVAAWREEDSRTTYLLDVRTEKEHATHTLPGFVHAPGGQLIQATDQWVGVRNARLVLLDNELVRAPMVAGWLRQLGHEAYVLEEGVSATADWPANFSPGTV